MTVNIEPRNTTKPGVLAPRSMTGDLRDAADSLPSTQDRYTSGRGEASLRLLPRPAWARRWDDKTEAYLADLEGRAIDAGRLSALREDLDWRGNEQRLRGRIEKSGEHRESMTRALDLAIKAHQGQTQKRPQDPEGLDNIPYVNHPIQVANMAFEHGLPWQVIEASILHDVVEDTPVTLDDLRRQGFGAETVELVRQVSRSPEESRSAYLDRVAAMGHDAKSIKCLDRYQNLERAFSVKDTGYLERYVSEANQYYSHAFEKIPELADMAGDFRGLLEEVKRFRGTLG